MGPETAEQWICLHLPAIAADLQSNRPGSLLYFVRFLDPDFHVRLRIRLQDRKDFMYVLDLIHQQSAIQLRQGLLWKMEICTYNREIERYGSERIELFERAFSCDSQFWIQVLPWLEQQKNREDLRWKVALVSASRYYRDLVKDPDEILRIFDQILTALKQEQKPTKSFLFQMDMKFRKLRPELLPWMEEELNEYPEMEKLLRSRSNNVKELFEPWCNEKGYMSWSGGDQNLVDLVHMSFNRGFRSRHRIQELVVYSYLNRLLKTQKALS